MQKQSLLKHEHHLFVLLSGEGMGKLTFLWAVVQRLGHGRKVLGASGVRMLHGTRLRGKVYKICWENKLSPQCDIQAIQIDTNQPPE